MDKQNHIETTMEHIVPGTSILLKHCRGDCRGPVVVKIWGILVLLKVRFFMHLLQCGADSDAALNRIAERNEQEDFEH